MKKQTPEGVLPWARAMIGMHSRACVIAHDTGLNPSLVKEEWHLHHGKNSPSGKQPDNLEWLIKTPTLQFQAAWLVLLYQESIKEHSKKSIAFANAYYHFSQMTAGEWDSRRSGAFRDTEDNYTIPYLRGYLIASRYTDATYPDGRRICPLILKKCRSCSGIFMCIDTNPTKKCPTCSYTGH